MRAPRVKETTTTSGTGTITLAGAVAGFQAVSSVNPAAAFRVRLTLVDVNNWEDVEGVYTLSGTTFTRERVHASSNSGALISLSGGSTIVFLDLQSNEIADLAMTCAMSQNMIAQ